MIQSNSLKQRIESVIIEFEEIMKDIDGEIDSLDVSSFAQLKEIEKTITSMRNKGLKIPDELRQLKLSLLTDCDHAENLKVLKKFFIETIQKKIFSKDAIEKPNIIKTVKKNTPTIKRSKRFPPDNTLCRFSFKGNEYKGQIKNGQFLVNGYGIFNSFSAASVKISTTSRNGWHDWELRIPGSNQWLLADIWRKKKKFNMLTKN